MEEYISALLPLYARERAANRAAVLAVVLATAGSTYSKAGTPLLIAENGEYAGLVGGGCLESDLRERAGSVLDSGAARVVSYDMRGRADELFGLGAGCEGAMDILVLRVGPENDWQPLQTFQQALLAQRPTAVGLVVRSSLSTLRPGDLLLPGIHSEFQSSLEAAARAGEATWLSRTPELQIFGLPLSMPSRVLILGAGPDALPVLRFALLLGWRVTMCDHRPAFADPERLAGAERVVLCRPESLADHVALETVNAAVVMSHHLESDAAYLRVLSLTDIGYVGLLGPASRKERLRTLMEAEWESSLQGRLRAPVGLPLGGRSSAAIALAIVAEIHSWLQEQSRRNCLGKAGYL